MDVLFRHHYPSLLRTAYALLGTREGAEDAVQDAFVSLYRHWGRLRDPGAVEAYVRSAVLNRCRSGIRSRAGIARSPTCTSYRCTRRAATRRRSPTRTPGRWGWRCGKLPRRQREVVACRYLLELSVAETAEILGISGGAVKRHAHRGLQALHTVLEVTR